MLLLVGTTAAAGTTYKVSTAPELQAAVNLVNVGPGGDLIVLAPGFYAITSELLIVRDVTIQGDPLAPSVIDGAVIQGGNGFILNVRGNGTNNQTNISIQNLTLQNSSNAIHFEARGVFSGTGVTITGNTLGFYPGDSGGVTFFTNSTIANNGVGIEIFCADMQLTNVTVSNNSTGVSFDSCTNDRMQITNSLIVANGLDCGGNNGFITVGDASFDSDGSCVSMGFGPGLTTKSLAAIGLGSLAANGGPTMTEAIAASSVAVDVGDNTDNLDPNPVVTCNPSGNVFPINPPGISTTVVCTASDASGNISPPGTFHVHVRGAGEQLTNMVALVESFGLDEEVEHHLIRLLQHAASELGEGELQPVCRGLSQFLRAVAAFARAHDERGHDREEPRREEERGAPLTQQQAALLTTDAVRVEAVLACPPSRDE